MVGYKLAYEAEEIDELLRKVDEKDIYDNASGDGHGLMSADDKEKLDGIETLSNDEIAEIIQ